MHSDVTLTDGGVLVVEMITVNNNLFMVLCYNKVYGTGLLIVAVLWDMSQDVNMHDCCMKFSFCNFAWIILYDHG